MNATLQSGLASSTQVDSSVAQFANANAFGNDRDESNLLDLMSGDPDDIDAFFERMFAG